ncbi:MAG TPA: S41 family peptidase [Blastocatellia bacterium]|nr:S41 family peptidase [Blastocatellia bacterium]
MKKLYALTFLLVLWVPLTAAGRETRLVRYPHYNQGHIVFTYLADIWTADEDGKNVKRITVHKARDVYPKFSPDGKWIAFSSDRNGNMDVFIVPSTGGNPKQLTFHSADDTVQGWTPDGKAVLFSSNRGDDFMPKLWTVNIDTTAERNTGADMGTSACYSPDGSKLAINRKGQVYWRKYYRGAMNTDVTVMDIAAKKFTDLTADFEGIDSWPMWSRDGNIYFVSDREGNGLTNVWRVPENGGKAERVTSFKEGDVRFPGISADGKVIVFEHDFGIWKLDVATRRAAPIKLDIDAEVQENVAEVRDFNSQADDYDLAPAGRRIAFSIHGEIFTAPTEEGDLRQITDSPARDQAPTYSPDGKSIAFISDRSGREELYIASSDGVGEPQKISDIDALKFGFEWSPNSKEIAFVSSDNKLRKYTVDSKQTVELSSSKYGNISEPRWSPDGKWIAYSKPDYTRTSDVYLIPSSGGEEKKATFDSYNDANPRFSHDGRKLYFVRREDGGGGGFGGGGQASSQIYSVALEKEERDPSDPEERPEAEQQDQGSDPGGRRAGPPRNQPPRDINIDWTGLKRRTRQITRMPFGVFNYAITPDNRSIVFVTTEPSSGRPAPTPVIYSIGEDGRRLTRIVAGEAPGGEGGGGGRGGFGGGGGISDLNITRDGRSLFFREGSSIYSVALGGGAGQPGGGAAAALGAGSGGREAARRRVNFTAQVKIDKQAEWAEMFDDAWRTMKYRFYDPQMHGKNWDGARAKYQPLVRDVGDRQELLNIINEMIGELNASHTGAGGPPRGRESREANVTTWHLGVELTSDDTAGRYKVTHVFEGGPADKDWVKVSNGDYLIAINGREVKAGENYWPLLNHKLNRKIEVTFNNKPSTDGAWKTRIEPINAGGLSALRYERWVKERRAMVDKMSNGRIGYLHIQAMNQPSLRKFEKEVRENREKEALIIDQRWNGGGNIEQELLAILVQREYQIWQPRGTEATGRPFAGYFGPKVVLQNWRSASNAEMFPAGFRALGLGKVIGTPTMGAVIGTGSYSLIDGSTVRTPGVGVFLADKNRTNMENYGVKPDIMVENTPEDNLAGRDRQLETAVQELLKEIGSKAQQAKKE